ncbi:MAG: exo-alpha-sialidase [Saprospiraceae bacterium]|nr:exo-alpha-sialidase [Saprospiraceae bacterium]
MALRGQEPEAPFTVTVPYNFTKPETLGLPFAEGAETFTIFFPGPDDNKYNHGVVLFPFRGMLYAQWQSSAADEDAGDTQVFYSRSPDGKTWSAPVPMTEPREQEIKTSGGWWSDGDTLVAYLCVWPHQTSGAKEGYTECIRSTDGLHWTAPEPVKDKDGRPMHGIIEQDVHALPGGRLITAFHMQPGLIATPYYTDDPGGTSGWTAGTMHNMPVEKGISRGIEPGWFYRKDSAVVMVFRDQQGSFKKLASVSHDAGATWSDPALVDAPASRAKPSAGNLPDGTAYMVNNPSGNKDRFPLVITISKDGFTFDKAYLLRSGGAGLPPMRYKGKYKRTGFSYPKSVVWGDHLYVSYATNKEDVELTRIPIESLSDR